ncbi:hypothetical protein PS918_01790 [Pseudomonas fluorescens]|uniref:Tyr recombinase domain-containing protein n=1 Tax=Pseudomonas fluorescens TaxID=294 RepID=A0A5E7RP32_PSEFL|nr:DUF6538 domain-containing protein [Pseudomonas fluorescens]VVP75440.1 hypothetical protein PS918_01790 [Pseudomonas fluorescens]
MSFITRRDGRYSYRRRFPADVAEVVGRTEYRKALGTADRTEALLRARAVSVEFDNVCEEARTPAQAGRGDAQPDATASSILESLDAVVRNITLTTVETMGKPGWQRTVQWQRQSLQAQADGVMPPGVQMHPVLARRALQAFDAVLSGNPETFKSDTAAGPEVADARTTAAEFKAVLDDYYEGVGPSRVGRVRGLSERVLVWPSSQEEQMARVMQYCADKLAAGGKATSVHADAAALITVLKRLPGWDGLRLPKVGATARAVRAGGGMNINQRAPVPLAQMLAVHARIKQEVPQWHAAVVLLARYGLRPGELLQEGPNALGERVDIRGRRELVFKAGLSGGKNAAARRDVPVHAKDVPLFRDVLAGLNIPPDASREVRDQRIRQRVRNLSRVFRRMLPPDSELVLYSQRHSFADLMRDAGATSEEVGGVLGHTAAGAKATSIYGGSQPLDRARELLQKVRELIPG